MVKELVESSDYGVNKGCRKRVFKALERIGAVDVVLASRFVQRDVLAMWRIKEGLFFHQSIRLNATIVDCVRKSARRLTYQKKTASCLRI